MSWERRGLAAGHAPGWAYFYSGWPKVFLAAGRATGCQRPILGGKRGAAEHPQLPRAALSPTEREQGARGERGESHTPRPSGIAPHRRLNRREDNERRPIISPLIGLWIFASVLKQSSPVKRAQPGAVPSWAHHWDAAASQLLRGASLPQHLPHSSAPCWGRPQKPPFCGAIGPVARSSWLLKAARPEPDKLLHFVRRLLAKWTA